MTRYGSDALGASRRISRSANPNFRTLISGAVDRYGRYDIMEKLEIFPGPGTKLYVHECNVEYYGREAGFQNFNVINDAAHCL